MIAKYVEKSEDVTLLAQAEQVGVGGALLTAAKIKRDELRARIETKPKHSPEKLEDDLVFVLGMVKALNWILGLPARSREHIEKL